MPALLTDMPDCGPAGAPTGGKGGLYISGTNGTNGSNGTTAADPFNPIPESGDSMSGGEPIMKFLRNLFGRKKPAEMIAELMIPVVSLMADGDFDASAPEIMDYLRDKKTPDVVAAIKGCDDLLGQHEATPHSFLMNPQVIAQVREALVQEVKRRGETHMLQS